MLILVKWVCQEEIFIGKTCAFFLSAKERVTFFRTSGGDKEVCGNDGGGFRAQDTQMISRARFHP